MVRPSVNDNTGLRRWPTRRSPIHFLVASYSGGHFFLLLWVLDRNPVRLAVTHLGRIRSLVHRVQEAGLTRWWWVGLKGVATPWLSRCDGHAFIYVFYIILLTHSNRKWPPSEFDDRNSGLSLNKKAKKGIEDPSSVVIYSLGRSNWASWERSYTTVTRSRAPSTITWPRGYSSGDVLVPAQPKLAWPNPFHRYE